MISLHFTNINAIISCFLICSCGLRAVNPLSIPTASITEANSSCDPTVKGNGPPASEVVRLHLTADLLSYLYNGTVPPAPAKLPWVDVTQSKVIPTAIGTGTVNLDNDTGIPLTPPAPISLPVQPGNPAYTRLDIDLRGQWAAGYPPILLEIMLDADTKHLAFIPNPDTSVPIDTSLYAVQSGSDLASTKMFYCRHPLPPDQRSVEFLVRHYGTKATGSLNIGVTITEPACLASGSTSCFVIPLLIDPKVPNSG